MRILFIHPRWERFLEARPELGDLPYARRLDLFRVSPLSIPTVAAQTPSDCQVELFDDFSEDLEKADPPDLAAISTFTPSASRAYELADHFRALDVPVVLGGIHPTLVSEEALAHADAVVIGEAEGVWSKVIEDARRGALKPLYRNGAPPPLAGLPAPRRDLFREKGLKTISVVQTGRGCERNCPTCVIPGLHGGGCRRRPPGEVAREVHELEETSFYVSEESLLFPDPENRAWAEAFLDAVGDSGKTFFLATYPFLLHRIEPAFLRRLERAGCRQFYVVFGVDDAGPDALWKRVDAIRDTLQAVREAGISVMGSFALGSDEDGPDCFERIFALARALQINLAEFFLLTPYPGTKLFRRLESEGRILTRKWSLYNGAHPVFQPRRLSPDELVEGYIGLWRAFYQDMDSYGSTLRFVRGFGSGVVRAQNEGGDGQG